MHLQGMAVAIQVTGLAWEGTSAHKLLGEGERLEEHQWGAHPAFLQPAAVCQAEQLSRRAALSANESD